MTTLMTLKQNEVALRFAFQPLKQNEVVLRFALLSVTTLKPLPETSYAILTVTPRL